MRARSGGGRSIHEVRSRRPVCAHAHVERPVAHKRKAALGFVELHGRDANIEGDAVGAALTDEITHGRESIFNQPKGRFLTELCGVSPRDGVAVERHHLGAAGEERGAVAARPEGAVDDQLAGLGRQRHQHLREQHRGMGRVSHWRARLHGILGAEPQAAAGDQRLAGDLPLAGHPIAEGFARPDLEAVAQANDRHPVGKAELLAKAVRQGDAAGGVE